MEIQLNDEEMLYPMDQAVSSQDGSLTDGSAPLPDIAVEESKTDASLANADLEQQKTENNEEKGHADATERIEPVLTEEQARSKKQNTLGIEDDSVKPRLSILNLDLSFGNDQKGQNSQPMRKQASYRDVRNRDATRNNVMSIDVNRNDVKPSDVNSSYVYSSGTAQNARFTVDGNDLGHNRMGQYAQKSMNRALKTQSEMKKFEFKEGFNKIKLHIENLDDGKLSLDEVNLDKLDVAELNLELKIKR